MKPEEMEVILDQLKAHGMNKLGERQDVTLDVSREILRKSF